jgi:pimeloyl-ACP methyl ester carboxylesterase
MGYEDRFWLSRDGLKLHTRFYAGREDLTPVVCIPGLTRNARDFEALAPRLATTGRRVHCVELRGRGESQWSKDAMTYAPISYLSDLEAFFAAERIERALFIGTSLGGLLTMMTAATRPGLVAGAVLNDIGPVIDPAGLTRIRGYVGKRGDYPSWWHAARELMDLNRDVYPDWGVDQYLVMAKRVMRVADGGRIVFDYDPRVAEPFRQPGGEAGVDLWPAFDALSGVPVLSIRGGLSDLFSEATQSEMARRAPHLHVLVTPRSGHAPTLDEPECVAAIEALVGEVR